MPYGRTLLLRSLQRCVLGLAAAFLLPATSADEELTLLSIEGNLVGKIASLDQTSDSALVIDTYYNLLPEQIQIEVETLRQQLSALMPGYEVAFLAADSAELAEMMFDIDLSWAAIRSIHAEEFTSDVTQLLNQAYGDVFSKLGADK